MNYCSACGEKVVLRVPPDDNRERFCCPSCTAIHYQNPRIIAGTLTTQGEQVLMCKRSIEPRFGLWTLPAGYMENGETLDECARRETLEEAGARVDTYRIYSLFSLPHIHQVYIFLRATLVECDFKPHAESSEVALFSPDDIPWKELAFPTVERTLRYFLEDLASGTEPEAPRVEEIIWSGHPNPKVRFSDGFQELRSSKGQDKRQKN